MFSFIKFQLAFLTSLGLILVLNQQKVYSWGWRPAPPPPPPPSPSPPSQQKQSTMPSITTLKSTTPFVQSTLLKKILSKPTVPNSSTKSVDMITQTPQIKQTKRLTGQENRNQATFSELRGIIPANVNLASKTKIISQNQAPDHIRLMTKIIKVTLPVIKNIASKNVQNSINLVRNNKAAFSTIQTPPSKSQNILKNIVNNNIKSDKQITSVVQANIAKNIQSVLNPIIQHSPKVFVTKKIPFTKPTLSYLNNLIIHPTVRIPNKKLPSLLKGTPNLPTNQLVQKISSSKTILSNLVDSSRNLITLQPSLSNVSNLIEKNIPIKSTFPNDLSQLAGNMANQVSNNLLQTGSKLSNQIIGNGMAELGSKTIDLSNISDSQNSGGLGISGLQINFSIRFLFNKIPINNNE